mmetsp:Transcript_19914/g.36017  ORF Transcript_19914/g.36017 Transcript_19914/m.36017 type:complete len:142 (-) Transcript_19914:301-726(-)|eukprot:CAMPEP_0201866468 /NCGR_PEP_ID=MMETSP0902-20130614/1052_1 /ASSEMBLY_ACC=CAM_ASM_000551 /TAXON_ID=420261 /ORGANISM="Thalassiosira antarctica, Strain CCMP982" /LENGTH=141 /DNA_ID=CAMNT_0048391453 /DNA_START=82 /DNA_END=507 /DNA_ORIENTATION=-
MTNCSFIRQAALVAVAFAFITPAHSFVPSNVPRTHSPPQTSTSINNFFKNAFANDEDLGKAQNAGLSNGPRYNDNVTVNGKKISKIVVDQNISQVCNAARVKVPYNCQNGECGTCELKINGKKARACVSKVPAGKCAIQTL